MSGYKSKLLQFFNNIDVPLDENGIYHETPESYLGHIFGFCGCGCPELILKYVYNALNNIKIKHDIGNAVATFTFTQNTPAEYKEACEVERNFYKREEERYFVLYRLDDLGLLEHGSSVGGSWLTDKGYDMLEALEEALNE